MTTTTVDPVIRHDDGPVVWLTLNRPDALNTLTRELMTALDDHLERIRTDDEVRAVVITGSGRAFCAGADLNGLLGEDHSLDPPRLLRFERDASAVFARLAQLPKPVIAAVNGITLAGGMELVLHCDIVIASDVARMGDGHINFGLLPGAGGAVRLARVIGVTRAKYLAFTGATLPAADLQAMGLVNEVVPAGDLKMRAGEIGAQIAARSQSALRLFKQTIDDGLEQPLTTALRLEHLATAEHLHSGDVKEGVTAFREKRQPRF